MPKCKLTAKRIRAQEGNRKMDIFSKYIRFSIHTIFYRARIPEAFLKYWLNTIEEAP